MKANSPSDLKLMPIQTRPSVSDGRVRESVYMAAYEVYAHVHGEQKAMIEDGCRGGFSVGELVAFLYAHRFPKDQWSRRVDEAFEGMSLKA